MKIKPSQKVLVIIEFLLFAILTAILVAINIFVTKNIWIITPEILSLNTIIIGGTFIGFIFPLYYNSIEYSFTEDKIIKKSGIFTETTEIMFKENIQHITVTEFLFNINSVTYSSAKSNMTLHFLSDNSLQTSDSYLSRTQV